MGLTESTLDAAPEPKQGGLSIQRNKIWSSNTGRAADGEMTGDIVAIKYKCTVTWPPLTQKEAAWIDNIISQAFFYVRFIDPASAAGEYVTIRAYAGDGTYPVYSYASGVPRYVGMAVDIIGK